MNGPNRAENRRYPVGVGVRRITSDDRGEMEALKGFVSTVEIEHGHPLLSDAVRLLLDDPAAGDSVMAVVAEGPSSVAGCAILGVANGARVVEVVAPHEHDLAPRADLISDLLESAASITAPHERLIWWCRDHEPWADAVASRSGLIEDRRLLQMRIKLDETTVSHLRKAVVPTRPFTPTTDDTAWLELNNRAFAGHGEQGAWSSADLRRRMSASWFDPSGFLLHPIEGQPIAFCWTKIHPADSHGPAMGEIYVIAVDPDHAGRGLGRSLTCSGLVHLADIGLAYGMLFVDSTNSAAVALYQSIGMVTHHVDRAFLVPRSP